VRVCRITSAFPPPRTGLAPGPVQLSVAQAKRGVDLTVLTRAREGSVAVDRSLPFRVVRIDAGSDFGFSLEAARRARMLQGEKAFDIVHGHGFSAQGLLWFPRGNLDHVPVVTHFHIVRKAQRAALRGNGGAWRPRTPREFWSEVQEHRVATGSDAALTVSQGLKEELGLFHGVPPEKIHVVGNGVDTELFSPGKGKGRAGGKVRLLWVGGFNGRKGEMDLLTVAALLEAGSVPFSLSMVGDGPGRVRFERLAAERGLASSVTVRPLVPFDRMPDVYREADLFIFPSRSEGMPKAVLEAMACGCPLLLYDIPGCRELVDEGKNGFLVEPGSLSRLVDAIRHLAREPGSVQRLGEESRRMVERRLTWDAVAGRVEECYRRVLAR
jgi:glycosyltransferase involved in cell wall biosynthesis